MPLLDEFGTAHCLSLMLAWTVCRIVCNILDKYVYAIDRLNEEVSAGNTTWDKVEYLCSDMLSD